MLLATIKNLTHIVLDVRLVVEKRKVVFVVKNQEPLVGVVIVTILEEDDDWSIEDVVKEVSEFVTKNPIAVFVLFEVFVEAKVEADIVEAENVFVTDKFGVVNVAEPPIVKLPDTSD